MRKIKLMAGLVALCTTFGAHAGSATGNITITGSITAGCLVDATGAGVNFGTISGATNLATNPLYGMIALQVTCSSGTPYSVQVTNYPVTWTAGAYSGQLAIESTSNCAGSASCQVTTTPVSLGTGTGASQNTSLYWRTTGGTGRDLLGYTNTVGAISGTVPLRVSW